MKILSIILKSAKEQYRNFWILLLTIVCAPFFILVYDLISESEAAHLQVLIVNRDIGYNQDGKLINYGSLLLNDTHLRSSLPGMSVTLTLYANEDEARVKLKNKQADLLLIVPVTFSERIAGLSSSNSKPVPVEFEGDLTSSQYLLSAIWISDGLSKYIFSIAPAMNPIEFHETSLGFSGSVTLFDMAVPGLMIFAIIMIMFSSSIAIVNETEKGTIQRIKMAPVTAFEFLTGVSFVQVILGVLSVLLTLWIASAFGFHMHGSFFLVLLVSILCSISIVAFGLILAALSKSANQILVIGNFPLFIFMFFTGAMFPMHSKTWFTILDYPVSVNSILSPVHAISALNKVLIMNEGFSKILPELIALVFLSALYFVLGVWLFYRRHLKKA
jgi:ABC-2 type transport system permease protein